MFETDFRFLPYIQRMYKSKNRKVSETEDVGDRSERKVIEVGNKVPCATGDAITSTLLKNWQKKSELQNSFTR